MTNHKITWQLYLGSLSVLLPGELVGGQVIVGKEKYLRLLKNYIKQRARKLDLLRNN